MFPDLRKPLRITDFRSTNLVNDPHGMDHGFLIDDFRLECASNFQEAHWVSCNELVAITAPSEDNVDDLVVVGWQ